MVPGVRYWKKVSSVRGTSVVAVMVAREMGGRRGWVDFEVRVTMFEGCKEGSKVVANGWLTVKMHVGNGRMTDGAAGGTNSQLCQKLIENL